MRQAPSHQVVKIQATLPHITSSSLMQVPTDSTNKSTNLHKMVRLLTWEIFATNTKCEKHMNHVLLIGDLVSVSHYMFESLKNTLVSSIHHLVSSITNWLLNHALPCLYSTGYCGITLSHTNAVPKNASKLADIQAAENYNHFNLGWFANPIYGNGDYPDIMRWQVGNKSLAQGSMMSRLPEFTEEEKKMVKSKGITFLKQLVWNQLCGFNYSVCSTLYKLL